MRVVHFVQTRVVDCGYCIVFRRQDDARFKVRWIGAHVDAHGVDEFASVCVLREQALWDLHSLRVYAGMYNASDHNQAMFVYTIRIKLNLSTRACP